MQRLAVIICLFLTVPVAVRAWAAPAYKGMSYTSFGADALSSSGSDQSLLNMSLVGTDTVAINFWWFQDTVSSNTMGEDFTKYSSTMSSVAHAIDTAHGLGMKVLLKPMLDVKDGTWRTYIDPSDKDQWFTNYNSFLGTFADMAQQKNVELLSLGCEMNTMEQPANDTRWDNLITNIKSRYSGKLTYAANWGAINVNSQDIGGYENVTWWNKLDYIGIDAYFPLTGSGTPIPATNSPSLAQLTTSWNSKANDIETWRANHSLTNKQVIFTEIGYRSLDGSNRAPWGDDVGSHQVDMQEQADLYQATLSTLSARSWWDGAFWWSWETNPYAGGASDNGFTPQSKTAQNVLQSFYGGQGPPPPPHGAPSTTFFSWENGLEGWQVPSFHNKPATNQQSASGATSGTHSLAVTQTGDNFSWDSYVTLTGDTLSAFSLALTDNLANYRLEYDVTYMTSMIPQSVTFLNQSIAINNAAGNWRQYDGAGGTNGHTNQTIHVSIPLSSFPGLTGGSSSYTIYLALNGNWGAGNATAFFDKLRLVNLSAPLTGDFNHDGSVDAADYVVWRDTLGSTTDLRADGNLNGVVDALDFVTWKNNFGATGSSGAGGLQTTVPEPKSLVLGIVAIGFLIFARTTGSRRSFVLLSRSSALASTAGCFC